ncbi:conserved hypothetical protein [Desulfamplus magnetovallimortis]|uniref:Uncharacterized protein n=1 Tax=Desulfamplus magnetovallimortis TaxID=1246637 RepID=A0A1W1HEY1_9BACT|nr:hypothetical protein [Desulfamplus magnetovallimortis]SLM30958.1 conserved hypothetical protein [Desulfamplus magnetovallimortis]
MKFIPVINMNQKIINLSLIAAIIRIAGSGLISLIDAFKQNQFGLDTLYNFRRHLEKYINQVIKSTNAHLYFDSGGYSFIQGQIHPDDIRKLITCYLHFMIEEMQTYYKIFSLDLPFSKRYNLYNTKENIFDFNRLSLLETFDIIEKVPQLADKFIFIWQFRRIELYRIWCILHDELSSYGYDKFITHRAIGGMVGLKGETKINFSPFIALSYRCFKDYITVGLFHFPFQLHLLGVYTLSDRFMIAYIEKVFERYLKQLTINSGVIISYDSTNYFRTAQYNARKMHCNSYDKGDLTHYSTVFDVPDNILRHIYHTDELYFHIQEEIQRLKINEDLLEGNSFAPLNSFNFVQEDKFIEDAIEKYKITDVLFESRDNDDFRKETGDILDQILKSTPQFFGPRFKDSIMDNMTKLYRLHKWWTFEGGEYDSLNSLVEEFIAMIKEP